MADDRCLLPHHYDQLVHGSGIAVEVIEERGYCSITDEQFSLLKESGFSRAQWKNVPGLCLPLWTTDGQNGLMVYRPDTPRLDTKGTTLKYEIPAKHGVRLDCPPRCQPRLNNPAEPLWVTEGQKKADALASHDLCAIALLGVWNFKGKNSWGGVTFLADWDYVALNRREVRVIFDSDVMTKSQVRKALERLTEHLQRKGAHVVAVYLPMANGVRVGVDDYLLSHMVPDLEGLIERPRPEPQAAKAVVTLLQELPKQMRRPLSLIDEHAYAAAWIPYKREITESVIKGELIRHDPPIVQTGRALLVMRDDGVLFGELEDPQIHPMAELGLDVRLPEIPKDDRLWSTRGLTAYLRGVRPEPKEVFGRLVAINDHFLDFDRSLAEQHTMCEMLACQELATWFLDGFNVIGYLWPNGEKGSGKTKLENLVAATAYLGEVILASSTMAVLRDLADYGATLCFDEAERLDSKNADPEKLALLLSGNRRGSTMAVKELADDKRWITRHVSTYCPRLFSAIRLPGETLESRSIIVPLVRSANKAKANSEVLNPKHWPHPRPELIDDLWALALAHLAQLPQYEDMVNEEASLSGRLLEPWRPILSVAKWLQEQGVDGLFDRMQVLAMAYQTEKKEIVRDDFPSKVIEALHHLHLTHHELLPDASPASPASLHHLCSEGCKFEVSAKRIVQVILSWDEKSDDDQEDHENEEKISKSLSTKVGTALRQLRFKKEGQKTRGSPRQWRVDAGVLTKCIFSHGLIHLFPKVGDEGDAIDNPTTETEKITFTSPGDPQDVGDEGDAGDEVVRDNKNDNLKEINEDSAREPGCEDE
jgi:Domain of unknown function (DUF3854)